MARGRPLGPMNGPYPNGLRKVREKAGLTQRDVAELLGVSYVQVGRIERGYNRLSADHCAKLVQVLGCELETLACADDVWQCRVLYLANQFTAKQKAQWLAMGRRLLVEKAVKGASVLPFRARRG